MAGHLGSPVSSSQEQGNFEFCGLPVGLENTRFERPYQASPELSLELLASEFQAQPSPSDFWCNCEINSDLELQTNNKHWPEAFSLSVHENSDSSVGKWTPNRLACAGISNTVGTTLSAACGSFWSPSRAAATKAVRKPKNKREVYLANLSSAQESTLLYHLCELEMQLGTEDVLVEKGQPSTYDFLSTDETKIPNLLEVYLTLALPRFGSSKKCDALGVSMSKTEELALRLQQYIPDAKLKEVKKAAVQWADKKIDRHQNLDCLGQQGLKRMKFDHA